MSLVSEVIEEPYVPEIIGALPETVQRFCPNVTQLGGRIAAAAENEPLQLWLANRLSRVATAHEGLVANEAQAACLSPLLAEPNATCVLVDWYQYDELPYGNLESEFLTTWGLIAQRVISYDHEGRPVLDAIHSAVAKKRRNDIVSSSGLAALQGPADLSRSLDMLDERLVLLSNGPSMQGVITRYKQGTLFPPTRRTRLLSQGR